MNEADEVKVERSGFVGDEVGLGDVLRVAHLSAFLSCDVGSCLHTTYITRVVKYWGLAVATHSIGMAPLTCTCTCT